MRTNAIRGTAAAVLLSATVLGLAGCVNAEKPAPPGAGDSVSYGPPVTSPTNSPATTTPTTPPPSSGAPATGASVTTAAQTAAHHNRTDVTFAERAVLLRQQALTLAGAAETAGINPQLRSLAAQVTTDGGPAVGTLSTWLSDWGQAAPARGSVPTAGVLSADQLRHVTSARGTAFDMQWLQYLQANLAAAREAAGTEVAHGANQQAKQVARHWATVLKAESDRLAAIH